MHFLKTAICTNFKLSVALRAAFLITLCIVIAKHLLYLVTWNVFFARYKTVQGWNFEEMLLMYGIVSFSIGIVEVFFYGLKELPRMIEMHQLDVFLLQPKNLILNVAMSKGDISAIGEVILGILLMIYSGYFLSPAIVLVGFLGPVFIFSFYLYLSSLAFFITNSTNFIRELYQNANIVATQPNSAYRGLFRIFTLTLLPTAFISFFPIEYFRTGLLQYLFLTALGTGIFFSTACWIFYCGLKRYESGSNIVLR